MLITCWDDNWIYWVKWNILLKLISPIFKKSEDYNVAHILFLLDSTCLNGLSKPWNNMQTEAGPPHSLWEICLEEVTDWPDSQDFSNHGRGPFLQSPESPALVTPPGGICLLFQESGCLLPSIRSGWALGLWFMGCVSLLLSQLSLASTRDNSYVFGCMFPFHPQGVLWGG